jgi:hypothetical protein
MNFNSQLFDLPTQYAAVQPINQTRPLGSFRINLKEVNDALHYVHKRQVVWEYRSGFFARANANQNEVLIAKILQASSNPTD